MQADKLKGKVDHDGKLIINEPTNLTPGQVEVIILKSETITKSTKINSKGQSIERPSKVKAFQDWFAKTQPAISDLDVDETKWNYLKEKHNL